MPEGVAKGPQDAAEDIADLFWDIVDDAGNRLAVFDHRLFKNIRNGSRVTFEGPDQNGMATNVQPVGSVRRYTTRVPEALDGQLQARLLELIVKELSEGAAETGAIRAKRLRRLRSRLDRRDF